MGAVEMGLEGAAVMVMKADYELTMFNSLAN